jgi:hypothetical protein
MFVTMQVLEETGVPGLKDRVEFYRHGDNIEHNKKLRRSKKHTHHKGEDS